MREDFDFDAALAALQEGQGLTGIRREFIQKALVLTQVFRGPRAQRRAGCGMLGMEMDRVQLVIAHHRQRGSGVQHPAHQSEVQRWSYYFDQLAA